MHGHGATQLGALSLWAAFALGLTGGFGHCLAMCGPFVGGASLGLGAGGRSASEAARFQLTYHVGRLLTYALIGALLGALGGAGALSALEGPFSPAAITQYLKLAAGLATVALGIWLLARWAAGKAAQLPEATGALTRGRFSRMVAALVARGGRNGLPLGMMMGLLPCGPLLPVELAALASGGPGPGAFIMLAFGLGTVPALAGFGAASGILGTRARGWLVPVMGLAVVSLGAVTIVQGLAPLVA